MSNQLWIIGHYIEDTDNGIVWRWCGIFTLEATAAAYAKKINDSCFIAPVEVDDITAANDQPQDWTDSYYPALEMKEEANKRREEER